MIKALVLAARRHKIRSDISAEKPGDKDAQYEACDGSQLVQESFHGTRDGTDDKYRQNYIVDSSHIYVIIEPAKIRISRAKSKSIWICEREYLRQ